MSGGTTQYEHIPNANVNTHHHGSGAPYDPYSSPDSYDNTHTYPVQTSTPSARSVDSSNPRTQNGLKSANAHIIPLQTPSNTDLQHGPKKNKVKFLDRLNDWWWWELGSMLLSLACLVAMIIILAKVQGKSLATWHSSISLNAVVSVSIITAYTRYSC